MAVNYGLLSEGITPLGKILQENGFFILYDVMMIWLASCVPVDHSFVKVCL